MESLQDRLERTDSHDIPTRRIEAKTHGTECDGEPWIVLDELVEHGRASDEIRLAAWATGNYTVVRSVNERTGFTSEIISR